MTVCRRARVTIYSPSGLPPPALPNRTKARQMLAPRLAADIIETFETWIKGHNITEVECLVPDISGIPRGKILPANKFLQSFGDRGLRIPEAIFVQTISGDYPPGEDVTNPANADVYLRPDPDSIRLVP